MNVRDQASERGRFGHNHTASTLSAHNMLHPLNIPFAHSVDMLITSNNPNLVSAKRLVKYYS